MRPREMQQNGKPWTKLVVPSRAQRLRFPHEQRRIFAQLTNRVNTERRVIRQRCTHPGSVRLFPNTENTRRGDMKGRRDVR